MGNGRETKYKREYIKKAETLYSQGYTDKRFAAELGVSRSTVSKWKKDYSDFSDTIKKAKEQYDTQKVEGSLLRNAKKGNLGAQIFWLTNRNPDRWKNLRRNEITGADGNPIRANITITKNYDGNGKPDKSRHRAKPQTDDSLRSSKPSRR